MWFQFLCTGMLAGCAALAVKNGEPWSVALCVALAVIAFLFDIRAIVREGK